MDHVAYVFVVFFFFFVLANSFLVLKIDWSTVARCDGMLREPTPHSHLAPGEAGSLLGEEDEKIYTRNRCRVPQSSYDYTTTVGESWWWWWWWTQSQVTLHCATHNVERCCCCTSSGVDVHLTHLLTGGAVIERLSSIQQGSGVLGSDPVSRTAVLSLHLVLICRPGWLVLI